MNAIAAAFRVFVFLFGLCGLSASALATPVTWILTGVAFSDGGTASGSFVYNADTNTYTSVNITTTTGSSVTGATFQFVCVSPCTGVTPSASGALMLTTTSASSQAGLPGLAFFFSPALTNSGGTSALTGQQSSCSDATCSTPSGATRTITAGSVTGALSAPASVPALSEWALLLLTLMLAGSAALGYRRYRDR